MKNKIYDVIVVGGGHAGIEASLAVSRMGCSVLLVTLKKDNIGLMSCNPAIGGLGKGQLVKEIDALGGEMAKATDLCGIQFKILNASKGPAVWSSRAQVDMFKYKKYMQDVLSKQKNLDILETEVTNLVTENETVVGVKVNNSNKIKTKIVILAPGTFLNGLMHIGVVNFPGGRIEEKGVSSKLSDNLKNLDFRILRFKTGTCARLDGKTIDFSKLQIQKGDEAPAPFSFSTNKLKVKQTPCFITYTSEKTHKIIRNSLDRSPLFGGKITGTGVRYCPSLEDKVVKFPHHPRHQIFLEPEGLDTDEYYPNGLSTSLPEDVQVDFIHSVPGLENVKINRFGYGIEHDVIDARQLYPTLEAKLVKNLYLAGQINGSTGYEEAAAQGLIAGINAALKMKNKLPLILDRSTSYIGVLIDDVVTKGTNEPYRMFTSRVEYRLILSEDNADLRLRKIGCEVGLVGEKLYEKTQKKKKEMENALNYLKRNRISVDNKNLNLYQYLKRPEVKIKDLEEKIELNYPQDVLQEVEIETKYSGFIRRQLAEVKKFKNLEKIKIPENIDYNKIPSLSAEIKEKLSELRPLNLGQANRVSGVTPVAISILMVYFKKYRDESARKIL